MLSSFTSVPVLFISSPFYVHLSFTDLIFVSFECLLACHPEGRMHNSFHAAAHEKVLSQARKFPYPEARSAEDHSCNLGLILILRDIERRTGRGEEKISLAILISSQSTIKNSISTQTKN